MDSCGAVDVQVVGHQVATATANESPSMTVNEGVVDNTISTHLHGWEGGGGKGKRRK